MNTPIGKIIESFEAHIQNSIRGGAENQNQPKQTVCSYCGHQENEIGNLIVGDRKNICAECIKKGRNISHLESRDLDNFLGFYCTRCLQPKNASHIVIQIHDTETFLCETCLNDYIDGIRGDHGATIRKHIEFQPEHVQAGIAILSYFSTIIEQTYPETPITVSIEQRGLSVELIIKTPEGEVSRIEKALCDYGLVVVGAKAAEDLLTNSAQVMALKNKLEVSALEIRLNREMYQMACNQYSERIKSLEDSLSELHKHVGNSLSQQSILTSVITFLASQHSKDSDVNLAILSLAQNINAKYSKQSEEEVIHALNTIEAKDHKLYSDIRDVFKQVLGGVGASYATGWIGAILNSMPK